jgi:hypothetical protein
LFFLIFLVNPVAFENERQRDLFEIKVFEKKRKNRILMENNFFINLKK